MSLVVGLPRRSGRSLLEAIQHGGVAGDGAMGTRLLERGLSFDVDYEELSVSRPEIVADLHEAYLRAGAELIETNSFGANRFRLARHGHERRVREINLAAAALARRTAGERAWVAGAIGPTGLSFDGSSGEALDTASVREAFREQAAALAEGGVDAILIETMRWPDEIDLAVGGARLAVGFEVPVIALCAIGEDLTMADGTPIDAMGDRLLAIGSAVLGVNCGDGTQALAAAEALLPLGLPVAAIPSAGLPRRVGDGFAYPSTPDDFGLVARRLFALGVGLVGGCCGTTPEHVAQIAAARAGIGATASKAS